ncbi:MAG: hypothetical protein CL623_12305 [Arcobacter sp.]|nr:hypothetical protein [Arcobacter sp.]|tara:strand:+ start:16569 stop:17294 length:726 start_codon:yes stop_codon:yes gene_type:complete
MNENKIENKENEQQKLKGNEVRIGDDVLVKQDLGDTFLTTDVTITMMGYSYGSRFNDDENVWAFEEDRSNFQIQMVKFDEKGKQEKNTIRVNVNLEEDELNKMVGKTYLFKNVNVYTSNNNIAFGADVLGEEVKGITEDTFISNSYAKVKVSNLITPTKKVDKKRGNRTVKVEVETKDTLVQSVVKFGTRLDLKSIKIKDIQIGQLEEIKGKEVLIENIKVFKPLNGSATYSTETKPKIIK